MKVTSSKVSFSEHSLIKHIPIEHSREKKKKTIAQLRKVQNFRPTSAELILVKKKKKKC